MLASLPPQEEEVIPEYLMRWRERNVPRLQKTRTKVEHPQPAACAWCGAVEDEGEAHDEGCGK